MSLPDSLPYAFGDVGEETLDFSATGTSVSSGILALVTDPSQFTATGSDLSTGSVAFEAFYIYVTVTEVLSPMSASIREATPTTPDLTSGYIRLSGSAGAAVRGLVDVERRVPLGVNATVLRADLMLYKAESWAAGTHTISVQALGEAWEPTSVTWNTQPAVRGSVVTQVVPAGGSVGDRIDVNITSLIAASVAEDDAAGNRWYGVRITADTAGEKLFYSSFASPDYRPRLKIEWSVPPNAPEDLLPNGGRHVSETKPELVARHSDPDVEDTLRSIRVLIDDADDFATPIYDSGFVTHNQARFDLNAPPAGAPATPTLATATTYYWAMETTDNHGLVSPRSETARFQVTAKGTLVLNSPGATVSSPTPTISWTLTGATQSQLEVEMQRKVGGVYETHWLLAKHVSSVTSVVVPNDKRLEEGESYRVSVRVWDNVDREDLAGDRSFVEATQDVTLAALSV